MNNFELAIWIVGAVMVGGIIGVITMCLLCANKGRDEHSDAWGDYPHKEDYE